MELFISVPLLQCIFMYMAPKAGVLVNAQSPKGGFCTCRKNYNHSQKMFLYVQKLKIMYILT